MAYRMASWVLSRCVSDGRSVGLVENLHSRNPSWTSSRKIGEEEGRGERKRTREEFHDQTRESERKMAKSGGKKNSRSVRLMMLVLFSYELL